MNIDNLSIPESDRRILETLMLKKEQEHESEEYARRAHHMWQKKREEELKAQNEQKLRWQKYVQEKRKSESVQNLLRMEDIKQSLRASQILLEDSIRKRDERVEHLKREQDERKKLEIIERRDQANRKKAVVDANQKLKEIDTELQTQKHAQQLEKRLARAESSRTKNRLVSHRRVASANRMEEVRHQEKMLEVLADMELQTIQKRREMRDKEARARDRFSEIIKHRDRHLREARAEHEMKEQLVREIHRDLQKGLEQWQDQVMLLQWADSQRAEACVQAQKENRRLRVEVENKERQLQHSERMKKVKEAEDSKRKSVRDTIRAKDRRIHMLQQRREKEIQEGRTQAQTTADLREHLRRTLSPETFDRKVARVAMEMRIGSRPLTASPTMMRSHIYLG